MKKVTIDTGECVFCGQPSSITVPEDIEAKVRAYLEDREAFAHIQREFPTLPPDTRETMVSGAHGPCFDKAFNDE